MYILSEKARLQAEAKAAEDARKKAEAEAAAEARKKREHDREAARQALQQVESENGKEIIHGSFLFPSLFKLCVLDRWRRPLISMKTASSWKIWQCLELVQMSTYRAL